ncbi:MAG: hypothetical protein ACXAC7_11615 [Candidatus Hodarchaeales archaeon]|jgi:hypothetical protein
MTQWTNKKTELDQSIWRSNIQSLINIASLFLILTIVGSILFPDLFGKKIIMSLTTTKLLLVIFYAIFLVICGVVFLLTRYFNQQRKKKINLGLYIGLLGVLLESLLFWNFIYPQYLLWSNIIEWGLLISGITLIGLGIFLESSRLDEIFINWLDHNKYLVLRLFTSMFLLIIAISMKLNLIVIVIILLIPWIDYIVKLLYKITNYIFYFLLSALIFLKQVIKAVYLGIKELFIQFFISIRNMTKKIVYYFQKNGRLMIQPSLSGFAIGLILVAILFRNNLLLILILIVLFYVFIIEVSNANKSIKSKDTQGYSYYKSKTTSFVKTNKTVDEYKKKLSSVIENNPSINDYKSKMNTFVDSSPLLKNYKQKVTSIVEDTNESKPETSIQSKKTNRFNYNFSIGLFITFVTLFTGFWLIPFPNDINSKIIVILSGVFIFLFANKSFFMKIGMSLLIFIKGLFITVFVWINHLIEFLILLSEKMIKMLWLHRYTIFKILTTFIGFLLIIFTIFHPNSNFIVNFVTFSGGILLVYLSWISKWNNLMKMILIYLKGILISIIVWIKELLNDIISYCKKFGSWFWNNRINIFRSITTILGFLIITSGLFRSDLTSEYRFLLILIGLFVLYLTWIKQINFLLIVFLYWLRNIFKIIAISIFSFLKDIYYIIISYHKGIIRTLSSILAIILILTWIGLLNINFIPPNSFMALFSGLALLFLTWLHIIYSIVNKSLIKGINGLKKINAWLIKNRKEIIQSISSGIGIILILAGIFLVKNEILMGLLIISGLFLLYVTWFNLVNRKIKSIINWLFELTIAIIYSIASFLLLCFNAILAFIIEIFTWLERNWKKIIHYSLTILSICFITFGFIESVYNQSPIGIISLFIGIIGFYLLWATEINLLVSEYARRVNNFLKNTFETIQNFLNQLFAQIKYALHVCFYYGFNWAIVWIALGFGSVLLIFGSIVSLSGLVDNSGNWSTFLLGVNLLFLFQGISNLVLILLGIGFLFAGLFLLRIISERKDMIIIKLIDFPQQKPTLKQKISNFSNVKKKTSQFVEKSGVWSK